MDIVIILADENFASRGTGTIVGVIKEARGVAVSPERPDVTTGAVVVFDYMRIADSGVYITIRADADAVNPRGGTARAVYFPTADTTSSGCEVLDIVVREIAHVDGVIRPNI